MPRDQSGRNRDHVVRSETSGSDAVVRERPKTEVKWNGHAGVETGLSRRARLVMATGVVNVLT